MVNISSMKTPEARGELQKKPRGSRSYIFIGFVSVVIVLYFSVSLLHYSVIHNHGHQVVLQGSSHSVESSDAGSKQREELENLQTQVNELRSKIDSKRGRLEVLRSELDKDLEQQNKQKERSQDISPASSSSFRGAVVSHEATHSSKPAREAATIAVAGAAGPKTEAAIVGESPNFGGETGRLPGGKDRRILSMTDQEFRYQPVSVLMKSYGEAAGPRNCAGDFGNALVERWRATKKRVCSPPADAASPGANQGASVGSSSIDTYLVKQTRHHGNGDNLIHFQDVSVNMGLFADMDKMYSVVKHYVDTKHFKQPYVPYPEGFVQGKCTTNKAAGWNPNVMPGWNVDWTTSAFRSIAGAEAGAVCDEWVTHPVLVVQRDTFANFFHDSEDFVNAFLALAILEWKLGDTQMYLTDLYPEGPFWEMWRQAFSQGSDKPVRTAWDLKNDFGANPKNSKGKEHRVCFKNLAVGIYGPAAPITVASWNTPCSNTALVKAYADFVIRGMGLQSYTHYAQQTPSKVVTITYMSRRASTVWPEKKFCSDENSFFLCKLWDHFGIRSLGRMIRNDAVVVTALKSLEGETFTNGAVVKLSEVDFNLLSFPEQIKHDLKTDIMVGPHGAGLMHNIFMRSRATLVELFIDGSGVNRHFHNLAHWSGHAYRGETMPNPVDTTKLLGIMRHVIESTNLHQY